MHLPPNGWVANRFKILEYDRIYAVFESACDGLSRAVVAVLVSVICYF